MPVCVAFYGGIPPSVRPSYIAHQEERRAFELLKVDQLAKELEKNPALRQEMQVEAQRDFVFQEMQDAESWRINGIHFYPRRLAAREVFRACRKQAALELQQLRETERLSRERMAPETEAFSFPTREKLTFDHSDTGRSYVSITLSYPNDTTNFLPITTLAEFALKYQQETPDHLSSGWPPGKRYSLCEIPQFRCKPGHYRWLRESARPNLVKDSSYDDRISQGNSLGSWAWLAKLMWKGEVAANHAVKIDDGSWVRWLVSTIFIRSSQTSQS